jgi:hypothetical protein
MGEAFEERRDSAALDRRRPTLVRGLRWMVPMVSIGLILFGWELAHVSATPALVVVVLVLLYGTTLLGAFLIGRRRQRTIRDGHDGGVISWSPGWAGSLLAILPGFAILASQAVGRTSEQASAMVGLLGCYALTWLLGFILGLVLRL